MAVTRTPTRGLGDGLHEATNLLQGPEGAAVHAAVRRQENSGQGRVVLPHEAAVSDSTGALRPQPPNGRHVGIVGCGKFAFAQIAFYLRKNFGDVIYGAMDVEIARAASLYEKYGLAYYTDDAAQLIADPNVDTVFIASNHASHAEYAIAALEAGKTVHIEKPHVVTEDQLRRLCAAMAASPGRVALGFNRPVSEIGLEIKRALDSQPGSLMLNWFVAGHEIAKDHWYFRDEEGGRVLGNLCHWTDFVYRLVPSENRFPITINPTRAEAADADIAVTYIFGDGSIAAITFSAKGHAFEGVIERFSAHRGQCAHLDGRVQDVRGADRPEAAPQAACCTATTATNG